MSGKLGMWDRIRHRFRLRRWQTAKANGRLAEDLAHRYLEEIGYVVVARNYHSRNGDGELDLVARDGEMLVVVEVKSRETAAFGQPEQAVTKEKRLKLRRAALEYARRAQVPWDCVRFDIVSVVFDQAAAVTHHRNAYRL